MNYSMIFLIFLAALVVIHKFQVVKKYLINHRRSITLNWFNIKACLCFILMQFSPFV